MTSGPPLDTDTIAAVVTGKLLVVVFQLDHPRLVALACCSVFQLALCCFCLLKDRQAQPSLTNRLACSKNTRYDYTLLAVMRS